MVSGMVCQHPVPIMKLVTFQANNEARLGVCVDDNIFDLNACYSLYLTGVTREKMSEMSPEALLKIRAEMPTSMIDFLKSGDAAMRRAEKVLKRMSESSAAELPEGVVYKAKDVSLEAPIPWPGKVLCLARNYAAHIREGGGKVAGKDKMSPQVFMKPNTAVTGPGQSIAIPKTGNKIDWEAELAVVIGKKAKYVTQEQAYDYVAGYTVMNDVSERSLIVEVEDREPAATYKFFDWLNGKWMDTFAPMGPCLVTKEEIEDPHDLRITLRVNGETKQDASTGDMIFYIPELIEFASRLMTLEPGDVISTGTPSGVGATSGTFLKPGDVVETEIEGIGVLRNPVEAE